MAPNTDPRILGTLDLCWPVSLQKIIDWHVAFVNNPLSIVFVRSRCSHRQRTAEHKQNYRPLSPRTSLKRNTSHLRQRSAAAATSAMLDPSLDRGEVLFPKKELAW